MKPLLLLLLSHFSCVRLCVTPETAAHQAPHPSVQSPTREFSEPLYLQEPQAVWATTQISLSRWMDKVIVMYLCHGIQPSHKKVGASMLPAARMSPTALTWSKEAGRERTHGLEFHPYKFARFELWYGDRKQVGGGLETRGGSEQGVWWISRGTWKLSKVRLFFLIAVVLSGVYTPAKTSDCTL